MAANEPKKKWWEAFVTVEGSDSPKKDGSSTTPVSTGSTPTTTSMSIDSGVNPKILEKLKVLIQENNIPGIDYYEFKLALDEMKDSGIDEKTKFTMAYKTLKIAGCTKEALLSSIEKYTALIKREESGFDKEMETRMNNNVVGRKKAIDNANLRIEELTKEIERLRSFVTTETQSVQQEEVKIKQTEASFVNTVEFFLNGIAEDKKKINDYLT